MEKFQSAYIFFIMEKFQSAYKTKHSTETALLRVYNDVMLCIDQGKGCILVLLDLSAAFDTVDHAVLFNLLEEFTRYFWNCSFLVKIVPVRSLAMDIWSMLQGIFTR